jgi:chemotaxis-related protein WspB
MVLKTKFHASKFPRKKSVSGGRLQAIVFRCAELGFALDACALSEIVPGVNLRTLPMAPKWVAGLLNLRGVSIPVIDLCQLVTGHSAKRSLSTRIMVVHYPSPEKPEHLLGLLAERVTEMQHVKDNAVVPTGIKLTQAPFLGGTASVRFGKESVPLQIVYVSELLPDDVKKCLFTDLPNAADKTVLPAGKSVERRP